MKVLVASLPALAKSVLEREEKYSVMASGVRLVKSSPTLPARWRERRCVFSWCAYSGVKPRALAITFVLPKKSLYIPISLLLVKLKE